MVETTQNKTGAISAPCRKQLPSNLLAAPARMLQGGALRSAFLAARRTAHQIARGVRPRAYDQRREGDGLAMQAALADNPTPRAIAAELLKGRRWEGRFHALEDGAIRAAGTDARDCG
jgi:hypothetical protein